MNSFSKTQFKILKLWVGTWKIYIFLKVFYTSHNAWPCSLISTKLLRNVREWHNCRIFQLREKKYNGCSRARTIWRGIYISALFCIDWQTSVTARHLSHRDKWYVKNSSQADAGKQNCGSRCTLRMFKRQEHMFFGYWYFHIALPLSAHTKAGMVQYTKILLHIRETPLITTLERP